MRPIKLMMQAFGPYAAKENIDFSMLGNRKMFVISGKTGSGKTTIFDGISYAIYGKASGEDRNGPELRSQFASEDLPTEVALEFMLRGKCYYIWRSPQQMRKKKTGDGLTQIGAKAELYLFNEEGEKSLLAANVRDVDERIKEIMLIDSNQFRQILMIPQGEFRKLLTSDSKDKEAILQRLFHTEIYKRVEEKLKDEATNLKRTVERQVDERTNAIRGIQVLINEQLKSELETEVLNDAKILPLLKAEILEMDAKLKELKRDSDNKQKDRDKLQQSIYDAELIVKQMKTKEDLFIKKQELESRKEEFIQKEQEVQLGNKAALLAKQEQVCHHLKAELEQARKESEQISFRLENLTRKLEEQIELVNSEKAREPERQKAVDEVRSLQILKNDVYSFANIEAQVKKLAEQLSHAQKQLQQSEVQGKNLDELLLRNLTEKAEIEKGQIRFLENKREIELLESELEMITKYETLLLKFEKSKATLETIKGSYQNSQLRLGDSKALVEELERKWLQNQAVILAGRLQLDEACPVCGSTHHPAKAMTLDGTIPTEEDIKAAKRQLQIHDAEKAKEESAFYESQSSVNVIAQSLAELEDDILIKRPEFSAKTLTPIKETIQHDRNQLLAIQHRLFEKNSKLPELLKQMEKSEKLKNQLGEKRQQLAERIQQLTIEHTEKRTTLARMLGQIPEEIRTIERYEATLEQAVRRQKMLAERWEQVQSRFQEIKENYATEKARLETVNKQVEDRSGKLSIERQTFKLSLNTQGFESYQHYEASKKTEEEINQLNVVIRTYHEELRSVTDRYHELAELLKNVNQPNLEDLRQSFAELNHQLKLLQDESTSLFMKKQNNLDILDKVESINQQLKELEGRYHLIGHLYEISKGQNTYRITFERFVLASFLDDILAQANLRLTKMTGGRYQLLRKTDRSKGAGQSGLELLVFDQYTGQERHVKTLSGGEGFKASLSLALGLAEVVQQHAGGVSLETMFIDEGFGTLDSESLEHAIEALMDIQSSGRLVGIISHVPELKERIDARLEVFAGQAGSRTEFQILN